MLQHKTDMKRILRVKVSRFQDIFDIVPLTYQMHIRRSSFNRKRRRSSFNPQRLRLRHTHYGFPFRIQVSVYLLKASKKRIQNCFLLSLHNVSLQRRPINAKQHITLTYFVFGSTNVKYGSWLKLLPTGSLCFERSYILEKRSTPKCLSPCYICEIFTSNIMEEKVLDTFIGQQYPLIILSIVTDMQKLQNDDVLGIEKNQPSWLTLFFRDRAK